MSAEVMLGEPQAAMTLEDVLAILRYTEEMQKILKNALIYTEIPMFLGRVNDLD